MGPKLCDRLVVVPWAHHNLFDGLLRTLSQTWCALTPKWLPTPDLKAYSLLQDLPSVVYIWAPNLRIVAEFARDQLFLRRFVLVLSHCC